MKIVKESLNEIKRDTRQPGLKSIGVGTVKFIDALVKKQFDTIAYSNPQYEFYTDDNHNPLVLFLDNKPLESANISISLIYNAHNKNIELTLPNSSWEPTLEEFDFTVGKYTYTFDAVHLYHQDKLEKFFSTAKQIMDKEIKDFNKEN